MAETIGIQALSPDAPPPANKSIRAKISLIWPYSSSTKQCALLLADPDFRLRNARGQVRARFTGASARAVAEGKLGIGDELLLELRGGTWATEASNVNTPGKSVEGELLFRSELGLRVVKKSGQDEVVDQRIVVNESTPPPEDENEEYHETPVRNRRLLGVGDFDTTPIYSSPAFVKRQRLSGGGLFFKREEKAEEPIVDLEKELEEEERRPKKKQRISDVRDWRLTSRTPSPEKTIPQVQGNIDAKEAVDDGKDDLVEQIEDALTTQPSGIDDRSVFEETAWTQAARQTVQRTEHNLLTTSQTEISDAQSSAESRLFGFAPRNRDPSPMQPPPLPKLKMPDDPFLEPPRHSGGQSDGPSTPKLRPVPGYSLPLPSPFPVDAQQSPLGLARPAEAVPTEHELRQRQQSLEASQETTSDESAVLEINPTIAALARQIQHQTDVSGKDTEVSQSTDSGGFPAALSQALRGRPQHSIDSEAVATPDTEIRDDDDIEDSNFSRPSGIYDQAQSQHPQYLSDTEEDEELEQLYSQAALREAEQRRLREGVKERDFASERPRAGFAADEEGNVVPRGGASADDVVHEDDAEEIIEDMGQEPEESSDDEDGAEQSGDEIENDAADSALEAMIDMGTRSIEIPTVAAQSEDEEDESPVQESPATVLPQPAFERLPKTPMPPSQRSFGFGFGFDGTASPPRSRPTPQSQKERTMKKTYGSLFGFRVSPSPEKERQPQQQHTTALSTVYPSGEQKLGVPGISSVGRIQNEDLRAERDDLERLAEEQSIPEVPIQHGPLHDDPIESDLPREEHSPPRDTNDHTLHESQLEAALASSFGPAGSSQAHDSVAKPHDEEVAESSTRSTDKQSTDAMKPISAGNVTKLVEERSSIAEQGHHVPSLTYDDEEVPVLPGPQDEAESPQSEVQLKQELKHPDNPLLERPSQAAPFPSSAPVRSLGSSKVLAPPPSTAPRPSQVEVIDLGSSDDEDEDEQLTQPQPRGHDPTIAFGDESDVDMDAEPVDEETKVGSISEATQLADPVVDKLTSDVELPSQDIAVLEGLSPLPSIVPETVQDQPWPDAQQESFFAEQMQAGGLQMLDSPTMEHNHETFEPASQVSNRSAADEYHYFSFQTNTTDFPSFTGDQNQNVASSPPQQDDEVSITEQTLVEENAELKTPKPTANSEVIEIESSSPAAEHEEHVKAQLREEIAGEANEDVSGKKIEELESSEHKLQSGKETEETMIARIVDSSKQVSFSHASSAGGSKRITRAQAQKLTQSPPSTSNHPQMQVAASSFIADTPEEERNAQSELPITPEESQHRLESQPFDTQAPFQPSVSPDQQAIESQPFEAQIPATSFVPPTPEVTNEGLQAVIEGTGEAQDQEAKQAKQTTSKGTRRRAGSATDGKTVVRRSPRKSQAPSQSLEAEGDQSIRNASEDRASPPDTAQRRGSLTTSANGQMLSPVKKTPTRRSGRRSVAQAEIDNTTIGEEDSLQVTTPKVQVNRRSPRKSRAETQTDDEMKRDREPSIEDISPPPKRTPVSKRQVLEKPNTVSERPRTTVRNAEDTKNTSGVTPGRKSFTSRLGQVPEVISAWFTPRRSTRQQVGEEPPQAGATSDQDAKSGLLHRTSSSGLTTTKSYYYSLSNIEEKLNSSSQPGVENTVDIIAVVTDASSTPERAKSGPKDFFTIFRIADQSITSGDDADELGEVRVEVYRHWHATLPVTQAGDVVLLRGFVVKSRKRKPYLLSSDASAWLVWRFSEVGSQEIGTRKRPGSSGGVREEIKGPPVEFAEGERKRAKELRDWWLSRQPRAEQE